MHIVETLGSLSALATKLGSFPTMPLVSLLGPLMDAHVYKLSLVFVKLGLGGWGLVGLKWSAHLVWLGWWTELS